MTEPNTNAVLEQWREQERLVRSKIAGPGVASPHDMMGKSGLEFFQAMANGQLPIPPIGQTLNFIAVEIELGRAVFQGQPKFEHYNPIGTVHGGWIATLLYSALGCAVHSALPAGKGYTTLELKVNYVKALSEKVPLVRAEGKVIHVGGRVATADGRLVGPDGALYAHAVTTCLVFDVPGTK